MKEGRYRYQKTHMNNSTTIVVAQSLLGPNSDSWLPSQDSGIISEDLLSHSGAMAADMASSTALPWSAEPSPEPVTSPGRDECLAIIEISVLFAIFVMALVGNSGILLALHGIRSSRCMSRVHYFMLHLSVADILVAFFNVFPQLAWDITYRFIGPNILCKVVKYLQVFTLYLSTFILVAMAIDRYHVIYGRTTFRSNSIICARYMVRLAWAFSALCAAPQFIIFSVQRLASGETDCWASFQFSWGEKAYITWFVALVFVVPLTIITFCYSAVTYRIYQCSRQGGSRSGRAESSSANSEFEVQVARQLNWESQPETLCCLTLELPVRPASSGKHRIQVSSWLGRGISVEWQCM